jgi:hypothetical protein
LHARSDLDSDGVHDPSKVLYVRSVELPRPISDPDEVCREVVELSVDGGGVGVRRSAGGRS